MLPLIILITVGITTDGTLGATTVGDGTVTIIGALIDLTIGATITHMVSILIMEVDSMADGAITTLGTILDSMDIMATAITTIETDIITIIEYLTVLEEEALIAVLVTEAL